VRLEDGQITGGIENHRYQNQKLIKFDGGKKLEKERVEGNGRRSSLVGSLGEKITEGCPDSGGKKTIHLMNEGYKKGPQMGKIVGGLYSS